MRLSLTFLVANMLYNCYLLISKFFPLKCEVYWNNWLIYYIQQNFNLVVTYGVSQYIQEMQNKQYLQKQEIT